MMHILGSIGWGCCGGGGNYGGLLKGAFFEKSRTDVFRRFEME